MTDTPHNHWTHDEELLARFVLGRIDPEQASVLERHLQECAECTMVVQAERLLAAGVKLSGRREMKQRLATNIVQKDLGTFNWSRVATVAAVILFLITIWFISRWFVPDESPQFAQRRAMDTLPPSPTPLLEEQNVPQTATQEPPEDFVDAYPLARENGERKRVAAAESERGKKKEVAASRTNRATDQKVFEVSSDEIWLEGSVVSDAQPSQEVGAPMADARDKRLDRVAPKGREMMAISRAERPEFVEVDSIPVTVKQLPLAALHDQQRDAEYAKRLIQTFIKKTSRGLDITVFADSLQRATRPLERAKGNVIGNDSLVIRIGSKLIGYKFPAGWIKRILSRPDVETK